MCVYAAHVCVYCVCFTFALDGSRLGCCGWHLEAHRVLCHLAFLSVGACESGVPEFTSTTKRTSYVNLPTIVLLPLSFLFFLLCCLFCLLFGLRSSYACFILSWQALHTTSLRTFFSFFRRFFAFFRLSFRSFLAVWIGRVEKSGGQSDRL